MESLCFSDFVMCVNAELEREQVGVVGLEPRSNMLIVALSILCSYEVSLRMICRVLEYCVLDDKNIRIFGDI
jgi:hypothetical protein